MKNEKITIIIRDETLLQSVVSDLVTLGMIAACVFISSNSTFWQVVCLGMFLIYLSSKGVALTCKKFKTISEMKEWAKYI